jgi:signal transduction histidine kinase
MSETDSALPCTAGTTSPAPERRPEKLEKAVRHELRTQLNQIIGYSDLLIDEAEQRELHDMVPDLQRIHAAGLRLLDLINEHVDPVAHRADNMSEPPPTTD